MIKIYGQKIMKPLNLILEGIEYLGKADNRPIESISYDSRKTKINSLS